MKSNPIHIFRQKPSKALYRGYNIGIRLIDEFLAKSGVTSCTDFKETADVISKVAFKMFLGITTEVSNWNSENSVCSLLIHDNPLTGFHQM